MFETRYQEWLAAQIADCSGERRRRLEHHGHAEKTFIELIWWECVGHFDYLFGEFEVVDYKEVFDSWIMPICDSQLKSDLKSMDSDHTAEMLTANNSPIIL